MIYLLLSDKIREDHKRKFQEWIHGTEVENVMSFGQGVDDVVEEMTGKLAEKELQLTDTAMVLKCKAGEWEG